MVAHDGPGRALAPGLAAHLAAVGIPAVVRRLPPGILVDSLPLARAGARAVTSSGCMGDPAKGCLAFSKLNDLGLVGALQTLPVLLFSFWGGVLMSSMEMLMPE